MIRSHLLWWQEKPLSLQTHLLHRFFGGWWFVWCWLLNLRVLLRDLHMLISSFFLTSCRRAEYSLYWIQHIDLKSLKWLWIAVKSGPWTKRIQMVREEYRNEEQGPGIIVISEQIDRYTHMSYHQCICSHRCRDAYQPLCSHHWRSYWSEMMDTN